MKQHKPLTSTVKPKVNDQSLKSGYIETLIVLLYILVEFIPHLSSVEIMGTQWLYISVLNCLTTIYLVFNKNSYSKQLFKSAFFISYAVFVAIAGLSFVVASNVAESLVCYSRLLISFIAFLNLFSLIFSNNKIIKPIIICCALIATYQSIEIIYEFLSNFKSATSLDDLILNIKGNTGNKNILAASLVIKLPFIVFLLNSADLRIRISSSIALLLSFTALFIVNARSSFVGLFSVMMVYFIMELVWYYRGERNSNRLKVSGISFIVLIVAVLSVQLLFNSVKDKEGNYGAVIQRVESIEFSKSGSSSRTVLWQGALDFVKNNPLLGGGYGNWKIYSVPYQRSIQGWFITEMHVHNDFLEAMADTGVLGGLAYLLIFIFLAFYAVRIIFANDVTGIIN